MNFFLFVLIPLMILSFVIPPVVTSNCQLKERIQRAIRELPTVEELKHSHRGHTKPVNHRKRSANHNLPSVKRPSRDTIPQLAKSLETFLQKVIPNHSLVQDLMGYVTMPNPNVNVYRSD